MEKGWISKRMKNSAALGNLSIVPTEEPKYFNLSDSGSFREGLLHISQDGTTVHSSRSALSNEPSSSTGPQWGVMQSPGSCRSTTSAKRANYNEEVRFELNRSDFDNMEIIGKGSSGYVRKALRKSSNEIMALKVINVFEEEKRKQMMQEVVMMCDAQVLPRPAARAVPASAAGGPAACPPSAELSPRPAPAPASPQTRRGSPTWQRSSRGPGARARVPPSTNRMHRVPPLVLTGCAASIPQY